MTHHPYYQINYPYFLENFFYIILPLSKVLASLTLVLSFNMYFISGRLLMAPYLEFCIAWGQAIV